MIRDPTFKGVGCLHVHTAELKPVAGASLQMTEKLTHTHTHKACAWNTHTHKDPGHQYNNKCQHVNMFHALTLRPMNKSHVTWNMSHDTDAPLRLTDSEYKLLKHICFTNTVTAARSMTMERFKSGRWSHRTGNTTFVSVQPPWGPTGSSCYGWLARRDYNVIYQPLVTNAASTPCPHRHHKP